MMNRIYSLFIALVLAIAAQAQTLNVVVGSVTYQFPASQAGDMNYSNGTQLTIMGKTFAVSDISKIYIDDTSVTNNTVSVNYSDAQAAVTIAGNVAQYIEPAVSGAHVSLTQSSSVDDAVGEITYTLEGSSADGEFYMTGSYKATVVLNGLTMTNANPVYSGAAVCIMDGKRIDLSVKKGTENTLTDCPTSSSELAQKSALYCKGHLEIKGKGTLNVYGMLAHAIKSAEYMEMQNATVNIKKAVKDGISCDEYFLMKSGTLTISNVGDDGIQCDIDGTTSTGETTDHEDEDSGSIYIEDGTLTISITAAAAKGIKAAGDLNISGGTINVTTTGNGAYDSSERDAKGCAALKSDGNMSIAGGTLTLKSTGTGGKCIKADGKLTISDGNISATSTGSQYRYSSSITASAKAIKADGALTISGGNVFASSSSHEGIESKSTITISGGYVYAYASDDAINSSSDFTISGGYVMGNSSGNDGLDANGNFYIKGGNVFAVATRQPEVGIDANTEQQKKLYITGGNIVAIGGLEGGSSLTGVTAKSASYSKGTTYALYNGGTLAFAYKVPSNSSMGTSMVVVTSGTPTLSSGVTTSGTTFWNGFGFPAANGGSSVTLSDYSNGGGGPGGGGGPRW